MADKKSPGAGDAGAFGCSVIVAGDFTKDSPSDLHKQEQAPQPSDASAPRPLEFGARVHRFDAPGGGEVHAVPDAGGWIIHEWSRTGDSGALLGAADTWSDALAMVRRHLARREGCA